MGYLHIDNLYKDTRILLFKEVYALEKIHGTSSHIKWIPKEKRIHYFSGGEKLENFVKLFDNTQLCNFFLEKIPDNEVIIFGEAYGGRQQGMSHVYGPNLKFVAFDVKINNVWLNVLSAYNFCKEINFDFVDFVRVPATLESLDAERDKMSVQAIKNGMGPDKPREGIVIRPIEEVVFSDGKRCIVKHKRKEFRETKTPRKILTPEQIKQMEDIDQIVDEYVVLMRLQHIVEKLGDVTEKDIGIVIKNMVEDIHREGGYEINYKNIDVKQLNKAIGKKTLELLKNFFFKR